MNPLVNLSKVNFNLLKVLEALLIERHVSRAGERLHITQSAVSVALKQLREIYQDPLLIRGQQSRMLPTPLAERLLPLVQEALSAINQALVVGDSFDPKISERHFHLGMSDYCAFIIMPRLMAYLAKHAPTIRVVQHAVNFLADDQPFLTQRLDLVFGFFSALPRSVQAERLAIDRGVLAFCQQHPLARKRKVVLADLLPYPQLFVSLGRTATDSLLVDYLQKQGLSPQVSLLTPHTLIPVHCLPKTQYVAHLVEGLVTPVQKPLGLTIKPAPYDFPVYELHQYWHQRANEDAGHRWLRQVLRHLF